MDNDRFHKNPDQLKEYVAAQEPPTLRELRSLPDDRLVNHYDVLIAGGVMTPEDYRDELNRRAIAASTRAANRLAWLVVGLTVVQVVLVIVEIVTRGG